MKLAIYGTGRSGGNIDSCGTRANTKSYMTSGSSPLREVVRAVFSGSMRRENLLPESGWISSLIQVRLLRLVD